MRIRCAAWRGPGHLLRLLLLVVVVGAGGCQALGHPDAEGQLSSSETPPTATAPAPASATLSAEEQALRDAALSTPKRLRLAGEHFLSLHPYVYATGDLSDWQAMSDLECRFCSNVVDNVTDLHSSGGWREPWQQEVVAERYGVSEEDPNVWAVSFHFSHSESLDHDGSGGTSPVDAEDLAFVLQMRWTGQTWVIEKGQVR